MSIAKGFYKDLRGGNFFWWAWGAGATLTFSYLALLAISHGTLREVGSEPASVVATSFTPSQTSTGVAVVPHDKGTSIAPVVTSTSEKFGVVVRMESGEVVTAEADKREWAELKPGDAVRVVSFRGWLGIATDTKVRK